MKKSGNWLDKLVICTLTEPICSVSVVNYDNSTNNDQDMEHVKDEFSSRLKSRCSLHSQEQEELITSSHTKFIPPSDPF